MLGRNVVLAVAPAMTLALSAPSVLNLSAEQVHIQRPIGMPSRVPGFPSSVDVPEMSIARLSDVVCLPGGVLLAEPNIVLEECFSAPWERDYHHHVLKLANGEYKLKQPRDEPQKLPGKYICLDYQHYLHYGHFIVDVLSRVWAYDHLVDGFGFKDIRILVADAAAPFANDLLDLYGIPADRIVRLNQSVRVQELFVPTKSFQIQEFTSPMATGIWRKISNAARGAGGPERIYVSRSRNSQRPLVEEQMVEALVAARGFHIVYPEEVRTLDQVGLFANARLIVGSSGSNVFNLAFQRQLRAALIIVSPALIHYTDLFTLSGSGARLSYFVGDPAVAHPNFNPLNVHAPWQIDVASFTQALDQWLATSETD